MPARQSPVVGQEASFSSAGRKRQRQWHKRQLPPPCRSLPERFHPPRAGLWLLNRAADRSQRAENTVCARQGSGRLVRGELHGVYAGVSRRLRALGRVGRQQRMGMGEDEGALPEAGMLQRRRCTGARAIRPTRSPHLWEERVSPSLPCLSVGSLLNMGQAGARESPGQI